MKGYLSRHLAMGKYEETNGGKAVYHHRNGWLDFPVGDGIVFSHRTSDYGKENFPEHLHSHDYCELLFWERGKVQYLCGDRSVIPEDGCIVTIPAGKSHTARLLAPSVYERFVLYFTPAALSFGGEKARLVQTLFSEKESFSFRIRSEHRSELQKRLLRIETILAQEADDSQLLAYAEIVLLLHFLEKELGASENTDEPIEESLPEQVRELRSFLDENYANIESIEDVAAGFYYSREYVTRLFTKYFNLAPWKYVEQLRIREACARIANGEKITAVCYAVGYHSMSAFSAAFHRVMGASPSEYRTKNALP